MPIQFEEALTYSSSSTTSTSFTLSANNSGDGILFWAVISTNATISSDVTGTTSLISASSPSSGGFAMLAAYKVCDGTEGTSWGMSWTGSTEAEGALIRISGVDAADQTSTNDNTGGRFTSQDTGPGGTISEAETWGLGGATGWGPGAGTPNSFSNWAANGSTAVERMDAGANSLSVAGATFEDLTSGQALQMTCNSPSTRCVVFIVNFTEAAAGGVAVPERLKMGVGL